MNKLYIGKKFNKLTCAALMVSSFAFCVALTPMYTAEAKERIVVKKTIIGPYGRHYHFKHVKKIPSKPKKVIIERKVVTAKKKLN